MTEGEDAEGEIEDSAFYSGKRTEERAVRSRSRAQGRGGSGWDETVKYTPSQVIFRMGPSEIPGRM